jgi:hypothetical protein
VPLPPEDAAALRDALRALATSLRAGTTADAEPR